MSACEAAKDLGLSRKTYNKWEQRGLAALLDGLCDQQPGRPEKPVNEAEQALEKQLAELRGQHQLLEQKMVLKDLALHSAARCVGCVRMWHGRLMV